MSTELYSEKISLSRATLKNKRSNKHNRILKSKENIILSKCDKNKLKKYKLRKDGLEDPEVLDVSQNLFLSLKIKSPTNEDSLSKCDGVDSNELKRTNFLFKMVRRRHNIKGDNTEKTIDDCKDYVNDLEFANPKKGDNIESSLDNKSINENNNAFKIMMNSRNKSIGRNSPGKDGKVDDMVSNEKLTQRETKMKRTFALKKMAELKGSQYNKELEEYKEKCIKEKMEARADTLKNMLTTKNTKVPEYKSNKITVNENIKSDSDIKLNTNKEVLKCDRQSNSIDREQNISKEDEEFLKKLSPSLKKPNMLCYFKKVGKESQPEKNLHEIDMFMHEDEEEPVIKVKFKPRSKKKKKKKLSLIKNDKPINEKYSNNKIEDTDVDRIDSNSEKQIENMCSDNNTEFLDEEKEMLGRNRKRKIEYSVDNVSTENIALEPQSHDTRPKRNVKKPVKYVDQMDTLPSDDELHIFTPKKKKSKENKEYLNKKKSITPLKEKKMKQNYSDKDKEKKIQHNSETEKNLTKLAPIFVSKPHINPVALEAKQKFLQSGVPDKLKKKLARQSKNNEQNYYFKTVHVHQNLPLSNTSIVDYYTLPLNNDNGTVIQTTDLKKTLLYTTEFKKDKDFLQGFKNDVTSILQNIKQNYPKFPVYRTYRSLKSKLNINNKDDKGMYSNLDNSSEVLNIIDIDNQFEDPIHLAWTERYRAKSTKDIIGNFESIKELKKWLITWQENETNSKPNHAANESDSSDYYYNSDSDSKDGMKISNNVFVVMGPVGSGKTSTVYAVATELSMKVIEVNVSTKRTGKIMLQDLQEATQSHKVNRSKVTSSETSQEIIYSKILKKKKLTKEKKKCSNETHKSKNILKIKADHSDQGPTCCPDVNKTRMSLILVDDADIIFEQDDGFVSALTQIVQCSKRPVVIVTSSLTCPHLQKFMNCGNIIKMKPLLPQMLGTWLDILCLADSGVCWPGLSSKYLSFYKGDIRKTINYLQYHVTSQANILSIQRNEEGSQNKCEKKETCLNVEDENSSLSWVHEDYNKDGILNKTFNMQLANVWKYISNDQINFPTTLKSMTLWWNIPRLLNMSDHFEENDELIHDDIKTNPLTVLASVLDSISLSDTIHFSEYSEKHATPWLSSESDSVSETETFESYNRCVEIGNDIGFTLVNKTLIKAQSLFGHQEIDLSMPSVEIERKKDKTLSRHVLLTDSFSSSAVLDRRALSTDYWSMCRSICRIEKAKIDNHLKRNNRFCHYLKSAKVMCKVDSFDKLCDSLSSNDDLMR